MKTKTSITQIGVVPPATLPSNCNTAGASGPVASDPTATAAGGDPNGSQVEQLIFLENIVTENLGREDRLAEALAQIKNRKLFKTTGQTFRDYVRGRWQLSPARAYQLLRFSRLKNEALAAGKISPVTERAARDLDTDGKPRPSADDYTKCLIKCRNQMRGSLAKLAPEQRPRFLSEIQSCIVELVQALEVEAPKTILGSVTAPGQSGVTVPAKAKNEGLLNSGSPELTVPAKLISPATFLVAGDQSLSQAAPTAPPAPSIATAESPLPPRLAGVPIQPPTLNYGGVMALTMAEAKARGLI